MTLDLPADAPGQVLDRILVPLDGSAQSTRALDLAGWLPARELVLLRVLPEALIVFPGFASPDHERETGEVEAELEPLAAPQRNAGRTVEIAVRYGEAADEILAATEGYDLVVMATRGRSAAGRMLFGSTADRVSRNSAVPTLLVRTGGEASVPVPVRIVVPLDGSELAERALPIAVGLARAMSLPLHLARAVDLDSVRATIHEQRTAEAGSSASPGAEHTYEEAAAITEDRASAYLADTAARLEGDVAEVTTALLHGTPVFALLETMQPDDLVVMTSHGRHGFQRWMLGSVAEKLVRESRAPVLLVPTRDPVEPT